MSKEKIKVPKGFKLSADKKLWLPGSVFFTDAWLMAEKLRKQHAKAKWIFCLARGGYSVGAVVGNAFQRNDIHTISAKSYTGESQGSVDFPDMIPIEIVQKRGAGLLVLDDLFDSGKTARALKEILPNAYFAAVYARPSGKHVANYFQRDVPQEGWIVFPWEEPWSGFSKKS